MYATEQSILDRYGDDVLYTLADRDRDDQLDHKAIEHALTDATDQINGYLTGHYTLPLGQPSALLTRLCVDIALYWLGEDRGGASEERRKRYDDAQATLKKIALGELKLNLATPNNDHTDIYFSAQPRQFSRDQLRRF